MSEKLCVFCDHFGWNRFEYYQYSTMTDGTNGGIQCAKGQINAIRFNDSKWTEDFYKSAEIMPDDTAEFREIIQSAIKCPDYSPPTKYPEDDASEKPK